MQIHEKSHDMPGAGKWDISTTRYIPVMGGSRSRLPVYDDPEYRRYPGFVGIDEFLTPGIHLMAQLYTHMGGTPIIPEGEGGGFTALILGQTIERLEGEETEDASPPEEEAPEEE